MDNTTPDNSSGRVGNGVEFTQVQKKAKFFGMSSKLKALAHGISTRYRIDIKFGAESPYTDSKTVYLPMIDDAVSNEVFDQFVGIVHHEVAHCNHTDFEGKLKLIDTLNGKYSRNYTSGVIAYLWNVVEDVRIETVNEIDSPGSPYYFRCFKKSSCDKKIKNYRLVDTPEMAVTDIMMYWLCNHGEKFDAAGVPVEKDSIANHKLFDEYARNSNYASLRKLLDPVFKKIKATATNPNCTEANLKELMRRIAEFISKNTPSDQDIADSLDKLGQAIQGAGGSGSATFNYNGDITDGVSDHNQQLMNKHAPISEEKDLGSGCGQGPSNGNQFCQTGKSVQPNFSSGKAASAKLRKVLVESMMAHKNKLTKKYQDDGILDTKSIKRFMYMGKTNIFKNVQKVKKVYTAVDLCIDVSGSMGDTNSNYARTLACALESAVKGTDIRLGMVIYDNSVMRIKSFNQRFGEDNCKYITANGGTSLGKAVFTSSKYLYGLPEERKICIAITDGDVGRDVPPVDKLVRNEGIEVFYVIVGCSSSSVANMLKHCPIDSKYCVGFSGDFTKPFLDSFKRLISSGYISESQNSSIN